VVGDISIHDRKSLLTAEMAAETLSHFDGFGLMGTSRTPAIDEKRVGQSKLLNWLMLNLGTRNTPNMQQIAEHRVLLESRMTPDELRDAQMLWDVFNEDRWNTPMAFPQIHPKILQPKNLLEPDIQDSKPSHPNHTTPLMRPKSGINLYSDAHSLKSSPTYCSILPLKSSSAAELSPSLRDWKLENHLFLDDNLVIHCRNLEVADGVRITTNGHWLTLLVTGELKLHGRASINAFDQPVAATAGPRGFDGRSGLPDNLERAGGTDGENGLAGTKGADAGGVSIAVLGGAKGNLEIMCRGMDGGVGGSGGNGGDGASGKATLMQTVTGGKGGNGGDGGNGGTGGVVVVRLAPLADSSKFSLKVDVSGGNPGKGGTAGIGGIGSPGKSADGVAGRDGNPGTQGRYLGPVSVLRPN
jgi:hypothetical protein